MRQQLSIREQFTRGNAPSHDNCRCTIIVTSNLPFDQWTEVFASERPTGAPLDRLTHHVQILEMNGDSYRLKQSKLRSRSIPDDIQPGDTPQA